MIKLYEVSKDKTKYHIVTDKEVIENLETSLNEKEQQIERLQEQLNEATELLCDQVNRDEKWDGGFDTYQLSFIEKMGCYTNEKGEYVLPDKWGVK